jgi:hypothetical protein
LQRPLVDADFEKVVNASPDLLIRFQKRNANAMNQTARCGMLLGKAKKRRTRRQRGGRYERLAMPRTGRECAIGRGVDLALTLRGR